MPSVLADPSGYLAQFEEIERLLATEGWQAAFLKFQVNIGLVPSARPEVLRLLLEPGSFLPSGPHRDMMIRVSGNWAYLMTHEMRPFIDYRPDLGRIVSNRVPIVVACGTSTRNQRSVEISVRAAELLGTECVRFSGGHTAPVEMPRTFAPELAALLGRL